MLSWQDDLLIAGTHLYIDSRLPRPVCFVSHAHSDHLGQHEHAIATHATATLAEFRIGLQSVNRLAYDEPFNFDPDTRLLLRPAGHVLGSAMLHVTRPEGTLLYTGDFKLRPSLTTELAAPLPADHLVTESTFGLPHFKFPPAEQVAAELVDRVTNALLEGRQPIVLGYSLGKSQEITAILQNAGLPVTLHGAVHNIHTLYQQLGVPLKDARRYKLEDFHGDHALDLAERGVLVAPPQVARTAFVTRFKNPLSIVLTGWALTKGANFRYGVDVALPLSDHADFTELLELIEIVRPKKIFTHHGYPQFADYLRSMGLDATTAIPDPQLRLF